MRIVNVLFAVSRYRDDYANGVFKCLKRTTIQIRIRIVYQWLMNAFGLYMNDIASGVSRRDRICQLVFYNRTLKVCCILTTGDVQYVSSILLPEYQQT